MMQNTYTQSPPESICYRVEHILFCAVLTFLLLCARPALAVAADLPSQDEYPHMPYIVRNPGPEYADSKRMFQGIPGLAVAPGGRLWATWYGGGECEGLDNYVMLATSGDDGKTWSAPVLVIDPPYRASEPMLWLDPTGKLWFTWCLYPVRSSRRDRAYYADRFDNIDSLKAFYGENNFIGMQVWAMTTDNPDSATPDWSEPRLLAMETHILNKPTVLADGTWLWPTTPYSPRQFTREMPMRPLYSTDNGKTFAYRGEVPIAKNDRNADEPMIVERKDGSLLLLNRTVYGIGESVSHDQGRTWSQLEPSDIQHPSTRFFLTKLNSGNLLLVKHGPIDKRIGRSHLTAFLSKDDGKTWQGGLMLDERPSVSYPDGVQTDDGRIYVIYDRKRYDDKEILMAVFTEEDVLAGKPSATTRLRQLVNKATLKNTRY